MEWFGKITALMQGPNMAASNCPQSSAESDQQLHKAVTQPAVEPALEPSFTANHTIHQFDGSVVMHSTLNQTTLLDDSSCELFHELNTIYENIRKMMARLPVPAKELKEKINDMISLVEFIPIESVAAQWNQKVATLLGKFAELVPPSLPILQSVPEHNMPNLASLPVQMASPTSSNSDSGIVCANHSTKLPHNVLNEIDSFCRLRVKPSAQPVSPDLTDIRIKLASGFVKIEAVKSQDTELALQMLLCLLAKARKILAAFDDDSKTISQQVFSWTVSALNNQFGIVYTSKCTNPSLSTLIFFICGSLAKRSAIDQQCTGNGSKLLQHRVRPTAQCSNARPPVCFNCFRSGHISKHCTNEEASATDLLKSLY